ncbi:hypothetical protein CZ771_14155 [Actinomycetales bacterium JB111]|nr:hypothetical protein CZ771_14155 [Actinomycetales bacterium JB111]
MGPTSRSGVVSVRQATARRPHAGASLRSLPSVVGGPSRPESHPGGPARQRRRTPPDRARSLTSGACCRRQLLT